MTQLIGLTGGIACGKSAVSSRLSERGAIIVDADLIAREVLAPQSIGLTQVVERWGEDVLLPNGSLDRVKLGALIFQRPEERRELEAITHPLIAQRSEALILTALAQQPPLVVYDAALLIEAGRAEHFRPLVVVATTPELQVDRIITRDGISKIEAQKRIQAQMPVERKVELADYVIINDGDWEQLNQQINDLWQTLVLKGAVNQK